MIELAAPVLDATTHGQVTRMELPKIDGAVISGKYGPGWQPAYEARVRFQQAGIDVAFPRGSTPAESYSGYTFSCDEEEYVPFPYMQDRFFQLIEINPYHTVVTGRQETGKTDEGYMGFSTAHEVAYAILQAKPIIISSRVRDFSKHVPEILKDIILTNQNDMTHQDPASLTAKELQDLLASLPTSIEYAVTKPEAEKIEFHRDNLCDLEMHRWFSWTIKTERDYFRGERQNWINEREARFGKVPRQYLPDEDLAQDADAQYYLDPAVYGSFMVRMHFPDFGK